MGGIHGDSETSVPMRNSKNIQIPKSPYLSKTKTRDRSREGVYSMNEIESEKLRKSSEEEVEGCGESHPRFIKFPKSDREERERISPKRMRK